MPEHDLDLPHDTLENLHDQRLIELVDLGDRVEAIAKSRLNRALQLGIQGSISPSPRAARSARADPRRTVTVSVRFKTAPVDKSCSSLGSVCARHMDNPSVVSTRHADAPWIAANLAVLNKAPVHVRLDVDFQVLAAKRTCDQELVRHFRQSYCNAGQPAMQ